jgi:hypothetical protein
MESNIINAYSSQSNYNTELCSAINIDSAVQDSNRPQPALVAGLLRDKYQGQWFWNISTQSWYVYSPDVGCWSELKQERIQSLVQRELDANTITQGNYNIGYVRDILSLLKGYLEDSIRADL